jgi:hypothetical protein
VKIEKSKKKRELQRNKTNLQNKIQEKPTTRKSKHFNHEFATQDRDVVAVHKIFVKEWLK